MQNKLTISPGFINSLSYTDFIGLINQWNVLPGAYTTLSKWIQFSHINKNSRILEVACTTGFTSREIALQTGCSGIGVDISEASIKTAEYNKREYAPDVDITYICQDATTYTSKTRFSHIIFGAALRFFPDPQLMLQKSLNLITDGGYLLSCEFYTTKKIPVSLIKKSQKVFNITPTQVPYKEVMSVYSGLEIMYEDRNILIEETPGELDYYCKSTCERAYETLKITDRAVQDAIYSRLYEIKQMSNLLRPYQNYNVLITRYRKSIYPNRYIELF